VASAGLHFREGSEADLATTFAISERAIYDTARRVSLLPAGREPTAQEIRLRWQAQRPFVEFMAAQPQGRYWLCEADAGPVGFARVVRLGDVEELTELMVAPRHQGRGIGLALLRRCWPEAPQASPTRVVVAAGTPRDLSLYLSFGVMPTSGHWHVRQSGADYLARRSRESGGQSEGVVLEGARALAEWQRLEPPALGHSRRALHEFMVRERFCLADLDPASGRARALCWIGRDGQVGPAVGERAEDLPAVVLAALDRVAGSPNGAELSLYVTSDSWQLLVRLRGLGFRVYWPSWIMSSAPLPVLDRYVPTRPPNLL
jgi:GNAT superfamily N-acetyltransferase